jgi:hypothetical protein
LSCLHFSHRILSNSSRTVCKFPCLNLIYYPHVIHYSHTRTKSTLQFSLICLKTSLPSSNISQIPYHCYLLAVRNKCRPFYCCVPPGTTPAGQATTVDTCTEMNTFPLTNSHQHRPDFDACRARNFRNTEI